MHPHKHDHRRENLLLTLASRQSVLIYQACCSRIIRTIRIPVFYLKSFPCYLLYLFVCVCVCVIPNQTQLTKYTLIPQSEFILDLSSTSNSHRRFSSLFWGVIIIFPILANWDRSRHDDGWGTKAQQLVDVGMEQRLGLWCAGYVFACGCQGRRSTASQFTKVRRRTLVMTEKLGS